MSRTPKAMMVVLSERLPEQRIAGELLEVCQADERLVLRQDIPLVEAQAQRVADRIDPDIGEDRQCRQDREEGGTSISCAAPGYLLRTPSGARASRRTSATSTHGAEVYFPEKPSRLQDLVGLVRRRSEEGIDGRIILGQRRIAEGIGQLGSQPCQNLLDRPDRGQREELVVLG